MTDEDQAPPAPAISLIVAMADNGVIGRDNDLPWRLPDDLKHFKRITMGAPIVMGRRTWQSIGRPLPGRTNIVVTRNRDFEADGALVAHRLTDALELAGEAPEVFVIGGATLYREALPMASRMYLTEVHAQVDGDTVFPDWDRTDWRELERDDRPADDKHTCPFSFVLLAQDARPAPSC